MRANCLIRIDVYDGNKPEDVLVCDFQHRAVLVENVVDYLEVKVNAHACRQQFSCVVNRCIQYLFLRGVENTLCDCISVNRAFLNAVSNLLLHNAYILIFSNE